MRQWPHHYFIHKYFKSSPSLLYSGFTYCYSLHFELVHAYNCGTAFTAFAVRIVKDRLCQFRCPFILLFDLNNCSFCLLPFRPGQTLVPFPLLQFSLKRFFFLFGFHSSVHRQFCNNPRILSARQLSSCTRFHRSTGSALCLTLLRLVIMFIKKFIYSEWKDFKTVTITASGGKMITVIIVVVQHE